MVYRSHYDSRGNYVGYTWDQRCDDHTLHFGVWDNCKGYPFLMERVYPMKQREVRDIYLAMKDNPKVKSVRIFGSTTNMKCHVGSDTDICVEVTDDCTEADMTEIHNTLHSICRNDCDILWWHNFLKGTRIYGNIRRGIVLF